jgi:hypothetical protein
LALAKMYQKYLVEIKEIQNRKFHMKGKETQNV